MINLAMDMLSVRSYAISRGDAPQAITDMRLDFSVSIYVKNNTWEL